MINGNHIKFYFTYLLVICSLLLASSARLICSPHLLAPSARLICSPHLLASSARDLLTKLRQFNSSFLPRTLVVPIRLGSLCWLVCFFRLPCLLPPLRCTLPFSNICTPLLLCPCDGRSTPSYLNPMQIRTPSSC